jgi:hypothetical protein
MTVQRLRLFNVQCSRVGLGRLNVEHGILNRAEGRLVPRFYGPLDFALGYFSP